MCILSTYIYIYLSTSFAHSCQLTAHLLGFCSLMCSTLLQRQIPFSKKGGMRAWNRKDFLSKDKKTMKFMSSTEDKPACKYSVCASKNQKQFKNCGFFLAPLGREGRGRPCQTSHPPSRETGLCFCWCLVFLWNPCTALVSLRCRNTAGGAKPALPHSCIRDAVSPARKRRRPTVAPAALCLG